MKAKVTNVKSKQNLKFEIKKVMNYSHKKIPFKGQLFFFEVNFGSNKKCDFFNFKQTIFVFLNVGVTIHFKSFYNNFF